MRLRRFKGTNVHGFMNFDLPFREDLTFLTGNNGSGKTSALNAILGLVTPDLAILSSLEFDEISLDVTNNDGSRAVISAVSEDNTVAIRISAVEEELRFNRFSADGDMSPTRQGEQESEYYRELYSFLSSHAVIKYISAMPSPNFLGLDRRSRFLDDMRRARVGTRWGRNRNLFGGTFSSSILDAAALAEERNREAVFESSRIVEELQEQMLLNLITVVPGEATDFLGLKVPTGKERRELSDLRKNLASIAQILRLSPKAVSARVTPLLDKLDKLAKVIPDTVTNEWLAKQKEPPDRKIVDALFAWSANQPHLERIISTSVIAGQYNEMRAAALKPIEAYRKLINDFLVDSGKKLVFSDRGEIAIEIEGITGLRPVTQMSSGEAQLFVILTHLSFSSGSLSNVFIIDEPELSLHVRWQELFVDSLLSANRSIQYILATHSPSIILDRVRNCVDADAKRPRPRRRAQPV